ncbi:DsbA family protein [Asticcacaulis tiandongensis]|uniref:DsbA family protein n=1 Tax=Asticcacaulis tiandongensis TaxID=2565365 RepID=UPI00112E8F59|nr:DsbA family protein [Asticcacaulis tiandongensis]
MTLTRKTLVKSALATGLLLAGLGLAACGNKAANIGADDMSMGPADAKVTLIEYASVTCVHCATFNEKVFPAIKEKYIDTGKVRYVYREFLTGPADVSAAGVLVARCAGKDKYFQVIDAVMRSQNEIFTSGDSKGVLMRIASSAGLSEEQFTQCVNDPEGVKRINDNMETYVKTYNITGTPSFFINDKKYEGDITDPNALGAALDAALAEAK